MFKSGTKLQHYKGGKYTVIGMGTHSETLEEMIIYQNDKDQKVWIRPIQMFYETVEHKGETIPRFKEIIPPENNYGKVGEALYVKYSSDEFFKLSGDRYEDGYIISVEEFDKKYGFTSTPIHIDNSTQGRYECVCEFGVEVYK